MVLNFYGPSKSFNISKQKREIFFLRNTFGNVKRYVRRKYLDNIRRCERTIS